MNEGLVAMTRAIIAFFSILIFARVLGKQQISQLTFFDYVLGITIGSIAATLTTDLSSSAWPHWVGLFIWALLGYIIEWITIKWRYAGKYLDGQPTIVMMNGKILEDTLKKAKYRVSDLLEILRNKDIFDLNQVAFAILEPNGQISVLKKAEYQPVTPKDMNLTVSPVSIGIELIYDGMIIEENLKEFKRDKKWLMAQLKKQGINNASEVLLATYDSTGKFYLDTYKDHIKNLPDVGDYKGPY